MTTLQFATFLLAALLLAHQSVSTLVYGVDCSFPHFQTESSCEQTVFGESRANVYKEYMKGCRLQHGTACDEFEESRLSKNRRKPQSMVNYTSTGFKKAQAPGRLVRLLRQYWIQHKNKFKESWKVGDTRVNHWTTQTYMVSIYKEGYRLANEIYTILKPMVEQWTGMEQRPASLYGIRVYGNGSILAPHVDRYPLVSSVIINVAQDVEEPWPLEVIDRDRNAVNITMSPNDIVFYESHSLIHGRPFALSGTFMANLFCHFEPTGRHVDTKGNYFWKDSDGTAKKHGDGGGLLPPYILAQSPEEAMWRQEYPNGWEY